MNTLCYFPYLGGEVLGNEVKNLALECIASKWQSWALSPSDSSASLSFLLFNTQILLRSKENVGVLGVVE